MEALLPGPHIGEPLKHLFSQVDELRIAVEAGGEGRPPRLFIDESGYISVDYGEATEHE